MSTSTSMPLASRIESALRHESTWSYLEATVRGFASIELVDYFNSWTQDERDRCVRALAVLDRCASGSGSFGPGVHDADDPLHRTVGYLCFVLASIDQTGGGTRACAMAGESRRERGRDLSECAQSLYQALGAPFLAAARRYAEEGAPVRSKGTTGHPVPRTRRATLVDYAASNDQAFQLPLNGAQLRGLIDVTLCYRMEVVSHAALRLAKRFTARGADSGAPGGGGSRYGRPAVLVTQTEVTAVLEQSHAKDSSIKEYLVADLDDDGQIRNPSAARGLLRYAFVLPIAAAYGAGAFDDALRPAPSPALAASPTLARRLATAQGYAGEHGN